MIAVLDACVLYPPALGELLMWLAVVKAYEPRWTDDIQAEWMRSLRTDRRDTTSEQLERSRRLMDAIDPNSLVWGYEAHIASLCLPDENDRHVLAAANAGARRGAGSEQRRHTGVHFLAWATLRPASPPGHQGTNEARCSDNG